MRASSRPTKRSVVGLAGGNKDPRMLRKCLHQAGVTPNVVCAHTKEEEGSAGTAREGRLPGPGPPQCNADPPKTQSGQPPPTPQEGALECTLQRCAGTSTVGCCQRHARPSDCHRRRLPRRKPRLRPQRSTKKTSPPKMSLTGTKKRRRTSAFLCTACAQPTLTPVNELWQAIACSHTQHGVGGLEIKGVQGRSSRRTSLSLKQNSRGIGVVCQRVARPAAAGVQRPINRHAQASS